MPGDDDYGLSPDKEKKTIAAPQVDYLPPRPKSSNPAIGLIGTGGISEFHLRNYKTGGFNVAAISSRTKSKAEARRRRRPDRSRTAVDAHLLRVHHV